MPLLPLLCQKKVSHSKLNGFRLYQFCPLSNIIITYPFFYKKFMHSFNHQNNKNDINISIDDHSISEISDIQHSHNNLAFQYIQSPPHPLWNPSKAFYHFEHSIKGNHEWKSLYLHNYAGLLCTLDIH